MRTRLLSPFKKIPSFLTKARDLQLIRRSGLFDREWYLAHNPDVRSAGLDPLRHYLRHGGFEGRDPGPSFSSVHYLETYQDVKNAGQNPLLHYIKFGRAEGRLPLPKPKPAVPPAALFRCPVCKNAVQAFVPLSPFYLENIRKYSYPYTFQEAETLNSEQYSCPYCSASDRDRLYACYLEKRILQTHAQDPLRLLDIAPSIPLSKLLDQFTTIIRHTADRFTAGVDYAVDITNMPEIASNSYDVFICSHVLEHVDDDRKALAELYRVLRQGGWGILMVPIILTIDQIDEDPLVTDPGERWRRFGQYDHVRLYSKRGFVERVEAAGFHLKQLGVEYFGESTFREYGITSQSVLYIAEKDPV